MFFTLNSDAKNFFFPPARKKLAIFLGEGDRNYGFTVYVNLQLALKTLWICANNEQKVNKMLCNFFNYFTENFFKLPSLKNRWWIVVGSWCISLLAPNFYPRNLCRSKNLTTNFTLRPIEFPWKICMEQNFPSLQKNKKNAFSWAKGNREILQI